MVALDEEVGDVGPGAGQRGEAGGEHAVQGVGGQAERRGRGDLRRRAWTPPCSWRALVGAAGRSPWPVVVCVFGLPATASGPEPVGPLDRRLPVGPLGPDRLVGPLGPNGPVGPVGPAIVAAVLDAARVVLVTGVEELVVVVLSAGVAVLDVVLVAPGRVATTRGWDGPLPC